MNPRFRVIPLSALCALALGAGACSKKSEPAPTPTPPPAPVATTPDPTKALAEAAQAKLAEVKKQEEALKAQAAAAEAAAKAKAAELETAAKQKAAEAERLAAEIKQQAATSPGSLLGKAATLAGSSPASTTSNATAPASSLQSLAQNLNPANFSAWYDKASAESSGIVSSLASKVTELGSNASPQLKSLYETALSQKKTFDEVSAQIKAGGLTQWAQLYPKLQTSWGDLSKSLTEAQALLAQFK